MGCGVRWVEEAGGKTEVAVDVRVVSASSRNLATEISAGRLREDLYYRLGVVPLSMPPLAQRREDIPLLAKHFTLRVAKQLGVLPFKLSDEVLTTLRGYDWPGNVRQIRNVIETMLILAPNDRNEPIKHNLLPAEILHVKRAGTEFEIDALLGLSLRGAREKFERAYLEAQLQKFDSNISRAATFIGMERSALHRKWRALGIALENQRGERLE